MNKQKGNTLIAYLVLATLVAITGSHVFNSLRNTTVSRLAYEAALVGYIEHNPFNL